MNRGRKYFTACIALFAAFVLLTILVRFVDVRAIGPKNSEVGFAALNGAFHEMTGYKKWLHVLTDILGYLALLLGAFFAAIGVLQLIRGRSFRAVDSDILCLGALYAAAIFFYLIFEVLIINYRPVILDEGLEASYPSSHTMLSIVMFLSVAWEAGRRIRGNTGMIARYVCMFLAVFVPVGRLFSGVHWFTDILGGVLLGSALFSGFMSAIFFVRKRERAKAASKRKRSSAKRRAR